MSESPLGFAVRSGEGFICAVCLEADGRHLPTCPIVALAGHVRDLAMHTGVFLASVKDTLEAIDRVLRDNRPNSEGFD